MAHSGLGTRREWTARRVRISGSSVLLGMATIVGVIVTRNVFVAARQPIGWVVAASVTALVLWPIVDLFDRWLPRGLGILLTLLLSAGAVIGLWLAVSNQVQDQFAQLQRTLPAAASDVEERGGEDGFLHEIEFGSLVEDLVDQTSDRVAPEPTIADAAGTAPAYVLSGILTIFFLIWGPRMLRGAQQQISDDEVRDRVGAAAARAAKQTQHYVIAAAGMGIAAGTVGGLLAAWAGLPTPLVLGVVIGVSSVIPYAGILFGAVPMLILAYASHSATKAAVLAVAVLALQAGYTLMLRHLSLRGFLQAGPAVIVVAALVGSDVYGLGGALVLVVLGILTVAVVDVVDPPDPIPEDAAMPATPVPA